MRLINSFDLLLLCNQERKDSNQEWERERERKKMRERRKEVRKREREWVRSEKRKTLMRMMSGEERK